MHQTLGMNFQLLAIILVLLAVGAAAIALAARFPRRRDVSELWGLYGTEFAIVGLVAVAATDWRVLLAVLLLFGVRGLYEFRDLFGLHSPRWMLVVDTLVAGGVLFGACLGGWLWQGALAAAVVAAAAGHFPERAGHRFRASMVGATGILFPVLPITFVGLIGLLPDGLAWLLFVYIVVETNDAFALLFGKLFGRRKILPKLSPGKTVEGTIGGLVSGFAVGLTLAIAVFDLSAYEAAGCVGVVLAAGIAGDLFTSALKRSVGRKDFAPVMILHGGALDIYDSVVVAAPFFYAYHSLVLR